MRKLKKFTLLLMLFFSNYSYGQDSAKVYTLEAFFGQIIYNHPIARQAQLINESAKQQLRLARGGFDPAIKGNFGQKYYDGKNYFTQTEADLVWPSWFGAEFKAGIENNTGIYLNPQETVPPQGLYSAGISVPLLQGFMFDSRRAALAQAKIMVRYSEAEQMQMLNKLLLEAAKIYSDWFKAYHILQIKQEGFIIAEDNLRAISMRAREGDLPWIDTTEAYTEKQRRLVELINYVTLYENSRRSMSQYLWDENLTPLFLQAEIIPPLKIELNIPHQNNTQADLNRAVDANFYFQQLNFKLQNLEIDRRLWRENTKPGINVNYNYLFPNSAYSETPFLSQGYKWGLELNLPITWRKELSKRKIAEIKVDDARFELKNFENTLRIEINNTENLLRNTSRMINLQNDLVTGSERLQQAEKQRFSMGESTFFLLNARENKLLDEQQKRISLESELIKQYAQYLYLLGQLTKNF
ncbi:MAG: TolC family protein, partial [Bacteroidia bacterium]